MADCPRSAPDITASITSQRNLERSEISGDKLASEKATSFLPQGRSCSLQPVATRLKIQPGSKGMQNTLLTLEKSEAARRVRPSPSSPEASALTKEIVGTKAILQTLPESTVTLKAELSRMHQDFAKINTEDERWDRSMAQDGDGVRSLTETQAPAPQTPRTPLGAEKELLCRKSAKLEEPHERRASEMAPAAVGEDVEEEPWVWKKRRPPHGQGEKQPQSSEDLSFSGEETDAQAPWSICPSHQEGKGDKQSADDGASILSTSDILLATIADLKNSTTANATNTVAAKLMTILEDHRSSIKDKALEIVVGICGQISSIPDGQAKRVALHVVASLAKESAGDVVSGLLTCSLPCDSCISEVWRSLCCVLETSTKVAWNLLKELQRRPRFQESHGGCSGHQAGLTPLAAVRALAEMLKTFTCTMAMQGFYSQVFLALVTHIHFLVRLPECTEESRNESNTLSMAEHTRFAVKTLKTLLTQDRNYLAVLWMDNASCWDLLSSPEHHLEGILLLARTLVIHSRRHVTGLLAEVIPKLCMEDEERTLTARALFAGFIYSESAVKLLPRKNILAKLEDWQTDPRPTVRWLSLHGFGNMALHRQKVKRLKGLVARILVGLKEPDERTVKEALRALGNLLSHHQGSVYLGSTCLRIAEQLCPLLTDGRDCVRAAAIGLFGKLLFKLQHRHKSQMREHVLSHVVPFFLHLQESSLDVVEARHLREGRSVVFLINQTQLSYATSFWSVVIGAQTGQCPLHYSRLECCKWTLAHCNHFLGWKLQEEIEVLAHDDSQEALSQICQCLVRRCPDQVPTFLTHTLDYMKSPTAPLRRAATVLTGFLVFYLDSTMVSQEVMASLMSGLVDLEHDPDLSVSCAASVSLLQVKQACSNTATGGRLHALGKVFCHVSSLEKEKPVFEDSPFRRKRSLGVFEEVYF